jgi:hypothetical protein
LGDRRHRRVRAAVREEVGGRGTLRRRLHLGRVAENARGSGVVRVRVIGLGLRRVLLLGWRAVGRIGLLLRALLR